MRASALCIVVSNKYTLLHTPIQHPITALVCTACVQGTCRYILLSNPCSTHGRVASVYGFLPLSIKHPAIVPTYK